MAEESTDPWDVTWANRENWPRLKETTGTLEIADLFCGCGGMSLGVREGLRVVGLRAKFRFAVDTCEESLDVYADNFDISSNDCHHQDISDLLPGGLGEPSSETESEIKADLGSLDIVVAGPPCQGHSDLNNHSRRDDERNSLYLRVVRFVELVTPRIVLIENVPGVVHSEQSVVARSKEYLEETLEYRVRTIDVKAEEFGVPQRRRRHFLVAVNSDIDLEAIDLYRFEGRVSPPVSIYIDGLEDEPKEYDDLFHTASNMSSRNKKRAKYLLSIDGFDLPDSERPPCHRDGNHSYKSVYGQIDPKSPAQTITTGFGSMGQGRFVHPSQPRVITPHEAARLQSFPDFFQFKKVRHRTKLHAMIGNAVPPKLAAVLVRNLATALLTEETFNSLNEKRFN